MTINQLVIKDRKRNQWKTSIGTMATLTQEEADRLLQSDDEWDDDGSALEPGEEDALLHTTSLSTEEKEEDLEIHIDETERFEDEEENASQRQDKIVKRDVQPKTTAVPSPRGQSFRTKTSPLLGIGRGQRLSLAKNHPYDRPFRSNPSQPPLRHKAPSGGGGLGQARPHMSPFSRLPNVNPFGSSLFGRVGPFSTNNSSLSFPKPRPPFHNPQPQQSTNPFQSNPTVNTESPVTANMTQEQVQVAASFLPSKSKQTPNDDNITSKAPSFQRKGASSYSLSEDGDDDDILIVSEIPRPARGLNPVINTRGTGMSLSQRFKTQTEDCVNDISHQNAVLDSRLLRDREALAMVIKELRPEDAERIAPKKGRRAIFVQNCPKNWNIDSFSEYCKTFGDIQGVNFNHGLRSVVAIFVEDDDAKKCEIILHDRFEGTETVVKRKFPPLEDFGFQV